MASTATNAPTDNTLAPGPIHCSDEQAQLLDIAQQFCRDQAPISQVRSWLESDTGPMPALWPKVAELGWTAITIPEEYGGIGLTPAELVAVLEPMGQHLLTMPLAETSQVALALQQAGSDQQRSHWLPQLAAGSLGTLALYGDSSDPVPDGSGASATLAGNTLSLMGLRTQVADLPSAALVLCLLDLAGAPALVLLTADDIPAEARRRETSIDANRRSWSIRLDGIQVPADRILGNPSTSADTTPGTLAAIEQLALLCSAADACGASEGALQVIVDYLNTRVQFGRKIGSFQALKHPTVDVLTSLDAARSHLYRAATLFTTGLLRDPVALRERETAVRMAKAQAEQTLLFAGDRGVQFHGGFGFTWECAAGLFLRRGLWHQSQWGDARLQRKRLAGLLFD